MVENQISPIAEYAIPFLSLALWIPALGALALLSGIVAHNARRFAIGLAAIEMALVIVIIFLFQRDIAELQFVERAGLYALGIDGISVLFLPLTAFLTLLCILATTPEVWRVQQLPLDASATAERTGEESEQVELRRQQRYYAALLALCASLTGAFAAADFRLYCFFMALEAVPAWYLVARYGDPLRGREVAREYAIVMLLGCALAVFGLEMLASHTGTSDMARLAATNIPLQAQGVIFIILSTAFAIRAPVFPLHGWMPRVLEYGPIVGLGVFLVGLKIGTYGFLRFVIEPLPQATQEWGWIIATLGAIGAIYGGAVALIQTDLRRLLAYASLSHMGVILIGLFSANAYGIEGGLLQMLTIGMAVAGLYLISGFIALRVPRPEIEQLGALVTRAPYLSAAFLITALGAVGIPGTSGFNGEHLVVIGAYKAHWAFALMVGATTVLTAAYFLRYFQKAFIAQPTTESARRSFTDLNSREFGIAAAIAGMVLVVGLYTGPFIALTKASVKALAGSHETKIESANEDVSARSADAVKLLPPNSLSADRSKPLN